MMAIAPFKITNSVPMESSCTTSCG